MKFGVEEVTYPDIVVRNRTPSAFDVALQSNALVHYCHLRSCHRHRQCIVTSGGLRKRVRHDVSCHAYGVRDAQLDGVAVAAGQLKSSD